MLLSYLEIANEKKKKKKKDKHESFCQLLEN